MGVIMFLIVLGIVVAGIFGLIFGGQYLAYRRDARLEELKETKAELRQTKRALNVARSALQKVGNQYAHNPPLAALDALDEINALVVADDDN